MKIKFLANSPITIGEITVKLSQDIILDCEPVLTADVFKNISNDIVNHKDVTHKKLQNFPYLPKHKNHNYLIDQIRKFFSKNPVANFDQFKFAFPTLDNKSFCHYKWCMQKQGIISYNNRTHLSVTPDLKTQEKKLEMIELKKQGLSFKKIGEKYFPFHTRSDEIVRKLIGNVRDNKEWPNLHRTKTILPSI